MVCVDPPLAERLEPAKRLAGHGACTPYRTKVPRERVSVREQRHSRRGRFGTRKEKDGPRVCQWVLFVFLLSAVPALITDVLFYVCF
jgi:hypothetical protein